MRNFVQPGRMVTVTAPSGGVVSGQGLLIGSLFGIAAGTALEGASVELAAEGIFDVSKDASAFSVGSDAYWNATARQVTTAPGTGDLRIGVAVAAAGTGAATVAVRLGISTAA